jgi:signal transduction histidine kinase
MKLPALRSVTGRLWAALALLSLAVICVSALTWFALQRVDSRLQTLHRETLTQVAKALELSKRSSDLATSAPYLLSQRSNFLIKQEGANLIGILEQVGRDWPNAQLDLMTDNETSLTDIVSNMSDGIRDLVEVATQLENQQASIRARVAILGSLRELATVEINAQDTPDAQRLVWWALQSMNVNGLNAAYAGNLIGVGEEQRHYQRQRRVLASARLSADQAAFLNKLDQAVTGDSGVFELRRDELAMILDAQNALFRIRRDANEISELAGNYAAQTEAYLAQERSASSGTIAFTRISVAAISFISLLLALAAALYVSRYVTFNIARVSGAMVRLANGDRASVLPRKMGGRDEIGDLFRSFRSFRANALRLDRSNRQLDQRNALFEKVFQNISDGIATADASGELTSYNPAFAKMLQLYQTPAQIGNFIDWLKQGRFRDAVIETGLTSQHRGVCELMASDGQVLELRASQLPDDGRVWLIADVTERNRFADRMKQFDRIEALGQVAGATAHDFGNILSTIRTHTHLIKSRPDQPAGPSLNAIENAVDFGASQTDRLLSFARKQNLAPELVDINQLIAGMEELIEISLKPDVHLKVSLADHPLRVLVDPGQLESALFNLIVNANNAIPTDGEIGITLSAMDDNTAKITISDTGTGMDTEVLERAIEPFFTTRDVEGGTGLGLSIVYGFVRQTGGSLDIRSTPGEGTAIDVVLPLAVSAPIVTHAHRNRALLVEDDPQTRRFVCETLTKLGYSVSEHATGQAAVDTLKAESFDLIVSDIDLGPEMNGIEVIDFAKRQMPSAQKILMSGKAYSGVLPGHKTTFIEKPATLGKLEAAIAQFQ